jgi:transposase InsO family protein
VRALSGRYRLNDLLEAAGLARSTYYYHLGHPAHVTRPDLELLVTRIFHRSPNGCGHRQIRMSLVREFHQKVSAKSVLRVMRRLGLACSIRRANPWRKYSSYRGDSGKHIPNLLSCDFRAARPFEKLGTDVTEFKVAGGKAYLAPVYDMASKEILAWDISPHPDMAQQMRMLTMFEGKLPSTSTPILHSDMGWQYQHARWREWLADHNITQLMSGKGNCLDNAATTRTSSTPEEHSPHTPTSNENSPNTSPTGTPSDAKNKSRDTPRKNTGTCPSTINHVT